VLVILVIVADEGLTFLAFHSLDREKLVGLSSGDVLTCVSFQRQRSFSSPPVAKMVGHPGYTRMRHNLSSPMFSESLQVGSP
jgi:hypothetical protein